jgi:hypothetical protein
MLLPRTVLIYPFLSVKNHPTAVYLLKISTGTRIRTLIKGFGDLYSTIELFPYSLSEKANSFSAVLLKRDANISIKPNFQKPGLLLILTIVYCREKIQWRSAILAVRAKIEPKVGGAIYAEKEQ